MKITKEFLETVLQQGVSSFTTKAGTNPGDNVAGSLLSICVNLTSGVTLHLVNKTYSDDPEFQDYAVKFGLFTTENTLYSTVGPRLTSLLAGKGVPNPELPIPKFYGGNGDMSKGEEFLCMEDVRPSGYSMQNKFTCFNLEETTLIMQELARYHASTYYWIRYEGEKVFDEDAGIKRLRDSPFSAEDPMLTAMGTEMFYLELKSAINVLEFAGHKDLASRVRSKLLAQGKDKLYELLMQRSKLTDKVTFPCIIHGDLWVNNILLKYDAEGHPTSLKFVDFQQTRRGNIYEDLVYFIMTSTTPAFRKQHLAQVLNSYFESFGETLASVKAPLPMGFTRGQLINTVFDCFLAGYLYCTFAIPMQLADPVDPHAKAEAMTKASNGSGGQENGHEAQSPPDPSKMSPEQMMEMMVQGLEARSAMFYGQMINSPKAIARLVDITREMADMKIL